MKTQISLLFFLTLIFSAQCLNQLRRTILAQTNTKARPQCLPSNGGPDTTPAPAPVPVPAPTPIADVDELDALLGGASSFTVLAATSTTNSGPTYISGDMGVFPGTAFSGLAVIQEKGTLHSSDTAATKAQLDLTTAYNHLQGLTAGVQYTPIKDIGGLTLGPGIYNFPSSCFITGLLKLDPQGATNPRWVFQIGSTLITSVGAEVQMLNGGNPLDVYWAVGSSASIFGSTKMVGNIMAHTTITFGTSATLTGRALASGAAVTMLSNKITRFRATTTPTPPPAVDGVDPLLGDASLFTVLAAEDTTNAGPTYISGDMGVSPGTAFSGHAVIQEKGTLHSADTKAANAQLALTNAYNNFWGLTASVQYTPIYDIGGLTLGPGTYHFPSSCFITGTLKLDPQGETNPQWVFQIVSTLITSVGGEVQMLNGGNPLRVYWAVGSAATIAGSTKMVGNILAHKTITFGTSATLTGRALADIGSITMLSNTITRFRPNSS